MNDITYTFNQTSKERKALVPSAMKRTGGSKSRKCTLPHENLTAAQQRKLNGPVHTYNLSEPMGWEAFKSMPLDLQEKYLADISARFGVGSSAIGIILFKKSDMAVASHCKHNGIAHPTLRGRVKLENKLAFRAWVNGENPITAGLLTDTPEPDEPVIVKPEKPVEPVSSVEPDKPTARTCITQASLRMSGTAEDVLATLRSFLTGSTVELEVSIIFKEENK